MKPAFSRPVSGKSWKRGRRFGAGDEKATQPVKTCVTCYQRRKVLVRQK